MALTEHPELIDSFAQLGLSANEARVYLALLENHPITGYKLSKDCGILRPVVYEMLNRLVEKGGARIVKSNPDTYVPVEIKEFLINIESNFSVAKDNISKSLNEFLQIDDSDFFWNILGEKNIYNAIFELIERAENEIYISFESQNIFDAISNNLETKLSEGVSINTFSHYAIDTAGVTLYSFKLNSDFILATVPSNIIYVCADNKEGIIANITDEKSAKAVLSKNEAITNLIKQHIIHNIYLVRLWKLLGTDKLKLIMNNEDKKMLETIDKYLAGSFN